MIKVEICMDYVSIEGQIIKRPSRVARSQWLRMWERITSQGYLNAR